MKSQLLMSAMACLGVVVFCAPGVAEDEGTRPPRSRDRDARRRPAEPGLDPLRVHLRFVNDLRSAVTSDLDLSEDRQTAVLKIFADHLESVEKLAPEQPKKEDREELRKRTRELEQRARAAREAGDRAEARRLYEEIRKLRQATFAVNADDLRAARDELIRNVSKALNDDQTARFERLVRRLGSRARRDGPTIQFWRAVRRTMTELEWDRERRKLVGKIVRTAKRDADRSPEDSQVPADLVGALRSGLGEELGPELAEQFITKLQEVRQEMKAAGEEKPVPPPEIEAPADASGEESSAAVDSNG